MREIGTSRIPVPANSDEMRQNKFVYLTYRWPRDLSTRKLVICYCNNTIDTI